MQYAPICPAENWFEAKMHQWFAWWFGKGEPHQYLFYRCKGCTALVTWNTIRQGGCNCDLEKRLVPAKLSFLEKARILFLPWTL